MLPHHRLLALLLCSTALLTACSDDKKSATATDTGGSGDTSLADTGGSGDTTADTEGSADGSGDTGAVAPAPRGDCDPLDPSNCTLPWPSNLYLEADPATVTGYHLAFGPTSIASGLAGAHMNPDLFRRLDGYSVGSPLMALFPNLDISAMATEDDLAPSLAADAPILWFKVAADGSLTRVPYWVELDAQEADPAAKILFVRPGVILDEAAHYLVAFRNLTDATGAAIAPSAAFTAFRDGAALRDPELVARVPRFEEEVFAPLAAAGLDRSSLTLAWDFVTASSRSTHGPMLKMRDDALAVVGTQGPEMTITEIQDYTEAEEADIAFEVRGTFRAPYYMEDLPVSDRSGTVVGQVFHLGPDGLPAQNGFHDAPFWIRVPRAALGGTPQGLMQFGHGLLGTGDEIRYFGHDSLSQRHNLIHFATNWLGMAESDEGRVQFMVFDLDRFRWLSDLTHQGVLDTLLLARSMRERFASLPEIAARGIVVNRDELYYSGNSQGGIYGATYMALSTDVQRGHLGVPGQNYSTLLHRSKDFERFFVVLKSTLRTASNVAVALSAIQLLWDGVDPVSYWKHIETEPFAGNSPHQVLCAVAKGDYQVAPVTMEVVARSNDGLAIMENYDSQRTPWDVTEVPYPHTGSGLVLWDYGNPWGPRANTPPVETDLGDPHDRPRRLDSHNDQLIHFCRTGEIIDVCGGDGCHPE